MLHMISLILRNGLYVGACLVFIFWNVAFRYIATIDGAINKRHLIIISEGTVIEGIHCTPDSVELLPQQPDISRPRLRIVVILHTLCVFNMHKS